MEAVLKCRNGEVIKAISTFVKKAETVRERQDTEREDASWWSAGRNSPWKTAELVHAGELEQEPHGQSAGPLLRSPPAYAGGPPILALLLLVCFC